MYTTKPSGRPALALRIASVLLLSASLAANARAEQQSPQELLLKIMDLHSQLVTNETFLAQAKMIGAYLEAAQSLDDPNKVETYTKVLGILTKIKNSSATQETASPSKKQRVADSPKQQGKTPFLPGAALLEVFRVDDSGNIAEIPLMRTNWTKDLVYSGGPCILPERVTEIGPVGTPYAARFSFYYEAKVAGKYGFNVELDSSDGGRFGGPFGGRLSIGSVPVVVLNKEPVGQGICELETGFHRVEFLWFDSVSAQWPTRTRRGFRLKVLTPDSLDSVLITKDMLLMKTRE